jgi:hypothetical protein
MIIVLYCKTKFYIGKKTFCEIENYGWFYKLQLQWIAEAISILNASKKKTHKILKLNFSAL